MPLLILLPSCDHAGTVERDTVSLVDLPATIVDLAGLSAGAPFPGRSLVTMWDHSLPGTAAGSGDLDGAISELTEPNPTNPSRGRSPAVRGPLVSLATNDYVYIRNDGDGQEQLFSLKDDPLERESCRRRSLAAHPFATPPAARPEGKAVPPRPRARVREGGPVR